MELATRSFTSTTVEGDGSREVDGREETARELGDYSEEGGGIGAGQRR